MFGCFDLVRVDRSRSGAAGSAACEWKQSNVAGAFDGDAQPALVTSTDAGHAARKNLAALLYELRKNIRALVVDQVDFLDAELADFFLAEKLALAAARSTGTTTWTAGAAFTATASAATGTPFATAASAAMSTVTSMSSTRTAFTARSWR